MTNTFASERQPGTYIVMHDGLREKIDEQRETISVEGTKGDLQFEEIFDFQAKYACRKNCRTRYSFSFFKMNNPRQRNRGIKQDEDAHLLYF